MAREYPRWGSDRRLKPRTSIRCALCGEQAKVRRWIQINWFRGEDEGIELCKTCKPTPVEALNKVNERKRAKAEK